MITLYYNIKLTSHIGLHCFDSVAAVIDILRRIPLLSKQNIGATFPSVPLERL